MVLVLMTLCAGQRHRHRGHIVDTGEGECGARWRSSMDVYTLPFGKDNWREAAGQQRAQLGNRELSSVRWDDLEEGREDKEGGDM